MSSSSFTHHHYHDGAGGHTHRRKFQISAQDLMCKNNCGHYGNEMQEGYCSVCYKLYKQKQQQRQQQIAAATGMSPKDDSFGIFGRSLGGGSSSGFATLPKSAKLSLDSLSSPLSGFAKFEEKKRHQTKAKSFRSVFRKSPTPSPSKSGSPKDNDFRTIPSLSPSKASPQKAQDSEKDSIRDEINTFLLQFPKQIIEDVVVKVKRCEAELTAASRGSNMSIEEISDIAQDFYRNFKGKVDMVPCYQSMNTEDKENLMDLIEKYLTISLYKELFNPFQMNAEDEAKDLMLQNRIRGLNWITCKHLEVALNEKDHNVRDLVFQAINTIIGMDSVKPPQEKLACITQCSRYILEALGVSKQTPTSADDFLPSLIYIVIKANPTRLQSNINFISRFCNASRLMSGEDGYFFTNLCCAVSFIQNMKGESLGIPENEFQDYVSGKSIPSESWENYFSESLHSMEEMSGALTEIRSRHEEFLKNVENLRQTMQQKQDFISEQVDVILHRTPLTFKPRKVPTNIDEEDPGLSQPSLPPPLQPEVVNSVAKGAHSVPPSCGPTSMDSIDAINHKSGNGENEDKQNENEESVDEKPGAVQTTETEDEFPKTDGPSSQSSETDEFHSQNNVESISDNAVKVEPTTS